MAIPMKLGISFTQAEYDAMMAAAKVVNDTIKAKIEFNLNDEERQTLSKVGPERSPYMQEAILDLGLNYPALVGAAFPHADAELDLEVWVNINEIINLLTQSLERATELQMVAGHFGWRFTRDMYYNAERYLGDNVEGAQIVYDALEGAFEGQGNTGNT